MSAVHEVTALIEGGGPEGTTLALDLASRCICGVTAWSNMNLSVE